MISKHIFFMEYTISKGLIEVVNVNMSRRIVNFLLQIGVLCKVYKDNNAFVVVHTNEADVILQFSILRILTEFFVPKR